MNKQLPELFKWTLFVLRKVQAAYRDNPDSFGLYEQSGRYYVLGLEGEYQDSIRELIRFGCLEYSTWATAGLPPKYMMYITDLGKEVLRVHQNDDLNIYA